MHSNVAVLTKMQLAGLFGINRMLHVGSSKKRKRAGLLVLAIIGGVFAAGVLSALTSYSMTVAGFANALPAIVLMIYTMLALMLTFLKSSGVLAGGHDYDLVMSLPVSPTQVVFSRVIPVYLTNVLFCGIVMVPAALVLSAQGGATFFGTGLLVLTAFVVPLFPMTLALTAGTLVALASARAKRNNALSLGLSTLLVLGLVAVAAGFNHISGEELTTAANVLANSFVALWPPADFVVRSAAGDVGAFCLFRALPIAAFDVFIALASHFYRSINNAHSCQAASKLRSKDLRTATPFEALYRREFSRYFSCTIYALNSTIGVVLLLVVSALLAFVNADMLAAYSDTLDVRSLLQTTLPLLVAVFVSMTCTTSASLSLEGKSRWIMQSLPVRSIEIYNAKIAVNLSVIAPFALVSIGLLAWNLRVTGWSLPLLMAIPAVYACFISVLGMCMNIVFPRYDWPSEYYAVKGGALSVLTTTGLGILSSVVPLGLCLALPQFATVIMVGLVVVLAAMTVSLYRHLSRCRLREE